MSDEYTRPADHDRRMAAARRFAGWHLGYSVWADSIIEAYENPDAADERIDRERNVVAPPVARG
jgi:hypothetical protein